MQATSCRRSGGNRSCSRLVGLTWIWRTRFQVAMLTQNCSHGSRRRGGASALALALVVAVAGRGAGARAAMRVALHWCTVIVIGSYRAREQRPIPSLMDSPASVVSVLVWVSVLAQGRLPRRATVMQILQMRGDNERNQYRVTWENSHPGPDPGVALLETSATCTAGAQPLVPEATRARARRPSSSTCTMALEVAANEYVEFCSSTGVFLAPVPMCLTAAALGGAMVLTLVLV